jgi:hypothetical protein
MQSSFFRIAIKRFTTIAFPFEESSATNASKKSQIPRGCKPKFLPRPSPVIGLAASTANSPRSTAVDKIFAVQKPNPRR